MSVFRDSNRTTRRTPQHDQHPTVRVGRPRPMITAFARAALGTTTALLLVSLVASARADMPSHMRHLLNQQAAPLATDMAHVMFEEVAKRSLGQNLTAHMSGVFGVVEALNYATRTEEYLTETAIVKAAFTRGALHYALAVLWLPLAVLVHLVWNRTARTGKPITDAVKGDLSVGFARDLFKQQTTSKVWKQGRAVYNQSHTLK